ncbi:MAG: hypothetical protein J3R72DRAFT_515395 [Linnemannia gamsii]|nr:MAG: hypothetical protein J3R72DRAFT_515395 [Linnemannia gamsii]
MPEIRDAIIHHLPARNDLLACLLISHSWMASVQPWLWRHLYLYSALQPLRQPRTKPPFPNANLQNPPAALLHKNMRFVRQLYVKAPIDSRLLTVLSEEGDLASFFPALEALYVHGYCCDEAVIDLEIRFATRLIRRALGHTATLKELHLSSLPPSFLSTLLQALDDDPFPSPPPSPSSTSTTTTPTAISTTTRRPKNALDRLRLTDLTLPYNSTERTLFWHRCTTIRRRLEFDNVNCLNYACPSDMTFSHIEHLQLTNMSLISPYEQLQLMSQCPRLTSLDWGPSSSTMSSSSSFHINASSIASPQQLQQTNSPTDLSNRIAALTTLSPIPNVHTLALRGPRIADSSLAKVLSACGPLRKLNIHGSGFAQESIDMLVAGRHFQSLQEIDMSDCANVTSPMVEMILEQCPLLEVLVAPILKVCDIMTNSKGVGVQEPEAVGGPD